jgi:hypothetical protein
MHLSALDAWEMKELDHFLNSVAAGSSQTNER